MTRAIIDDVDVTKTIVDRLSGNIVMVELTVGRSDGTCFTQTVTIREGE